MQILLNNSFLQTYETGKILVRQGDLPKYLYYIMDGVLKTTRGDKGGKEATIRMLKTGDTCMDAVIFMEGPSPIIVQVVEDAKVLMIPEGFVKSYVLKNPRFATNMLHTITRHYRDALHQLDSIITKPPVQRLGYYLLKLHLEEEFKNRIITLPFQKQLIASHLGMTPESFSRALKKLKKFGIEIDREHVSLPHSFALCSFCDPDTSFICPDKNEDQCLSWVRKG